MKRSIVVILWALVLVLVASVAFAAVGTKTPVPKTPAAKAAPDADDNGVHGGPKARVHAGCTLASGLSGNWTHGDYVSAVAKASPTNTDKIRAAAHSNCGKVDHSKKNGKPAKPA